MEIISTVADLGKLLSKIPKNKTLGFVPTMGALHQGHLNLVQQAIVENEICLCSIFVNPTQFNSTEDLDKYPNQIETDLKLLKSIGCNIVFTPTKSEIYPSGFKSKKYNFGKLDKVMEGANRPGHFEGVAMVVSRLFDLIKPQRAYFGEKDFQQLAIIKSLTEQDQLPIKIVPCPISRETDGLDVAIDRINRYCDAGADIAFIEAPLSINELEEICKRIDYPKFVNMLAFGKTPILSVAELEEMGFKMMVAPIDSVLLTAHAMREMAEVFKRDGHTKNMANIMVGFDEIKDILGLSDYLELDKNLK